MSDYIPRTLPAARGARKAVETSAKNLLSELTEATAVCCEDEFDPGTFLPVLRTGMLEAWLEDTVVVSPDTSRATRTDLEVQSQIMVLSLAEKVLQIDLTLERYLSKTSATLSTSALHVNIPDIMEELGENTPEEGFVALIAVPNFYDEAPQNDGRTDVLMGVALWQGFYLCRPALVSLEDFEPDEGESALSQILPVLPTPTISYYQSCGYH